MSLSPDRFDEFCGMYKYVCFEDGVVLFCDACSMCTSHAQLVADREGVKAISAGKIKTRGKLWQWCEGGSSTAKLPSLGTDDAMIEAALRPFGILPNDGEYWY
jgi:hypothetical protein